MFSKPGSTRPCRRGSTLIELLCSVVIIGMLVAMLMPGLDRGQAKVRQLKCINNLHQLGIAEVDFALEHDDRFPVQVSTNLGGSGEFLQAGRMVNGEFYFAYHHFLPLEPVLQTPKILRCPADDRPAASSFRDLRNTNLSYFAGSVPQCGKPDSILAGDRNVTPASGSIAHLGGTYTLTWTRELHRYKGNVLFADRHVEQLKELFAMTNTRPPVELVLPSVP
ncbi:MAG TPA: type II secretion system protein [Verrucomicrobiae bacterium]|nr:type II secretion system protein [Verrucomicrobiae bacterium]